MRARARTREMSDGHVCARRSPCLFGAAEKDAWRSVRVVDGLCALTCVGVGPWSVEHAVRMWRAWWLGGPGGGIRRAPSCGAPVGAVRVCVRVQDVDMLYVVRCGVLYVVCACPAPRTRAGGLSWYVADVGPAGCRERCFVRCIYL